MGGGRGGRGRRGTGEDSYCTNSSQATLNSTRGTDAVTCSYTAPVSWPTYAMLLRLLQLSRCSRKTLCTLPLLLALRASCHTPVRSIWGRQGGGTSRHENSMNCISFFPSASDPQPRVSLPSPITQYGSRPLPPSALTRTVNGSRKAERRGPAMKQCLPWGVRGLVEGMVEGWVERTRGHGALRKYLNVFIS